MFEYGDSSASQDECAIGIGVGGSVKRLIPVMRSVIVGIAVTYALCEIGLVNPLSVRIRICEIFSGMSFAVVLTYIVVVYYTSTGVRHAIRLRWAG